MIGLDVVRIGTDWEPRQHAETLGLTTGQLLLNLVPAGCYATMDRVLTLVGSRLFRDNKE